MSICSIIYTYYSLLPNSSPTQYIQPTLHSTPVFAARALNDGPFFSARVGAPNPASSLLASTRYRAARLEYAQSTGSSYPTAFTAWDSPGIITSTRRPVPCLSCRQSTLNLPASARTPAPQTSCEVFAPIVAVDRASSQT